MRTINNVLYNTYHEAAVALGIADDDQYIMKAITEAASMTITSEQYNTLRRFFVTMLVESGPADPNRMWQDCRRMISMDKIHSMEKIKYKEHCKDEELTEKELDDIYKQVYLLLAKEFEDYDEDIRKYIPEPEGLGDALKKGSNSLVEQELSYDCDDLGKNVETNLPMLTNEQRELYDEVVKSVVNNEGQAFSLDACGGSGKTTTTALIVDSVRSMGKIVLTTGMFNNHKI